MAGAAGIDLGARNSVVSVLEGGVPGVNPDEMVALGAPRTSRRPGAGKE
ncbi:hypothetical protein [Streptomyces diacarni]|nr:hypothetical protein [Streptomyces diacarni]